MPDRTEKTYRPNVFLAIILIGTAISGLVAIPIIRFELHKHSMERIAGHKISYWDAFWTQ